MSSNSYIFTDSIVGTTGANTAAEINATNSKIQGWYLDDQDFANMNTSLPTVPGRQGIAKDN
jgi:hypothetical protein